MRVERLIAVFALVVSGYGAQAQTKALLIGNERYADGGVVAGASDVLAAADLLDAVGAETTRLRDADRTASLDALARLASGAGTADGLLVVLAGRFVRSDHDTYFLPVGSDGRDLWTSVRSGIPVSEVLGLLSATPGHAILAVAGDLTDRAEIGGGLYGGVGPLEIPQGVTVIRGATGEIASILRDTLSRPGRSIAPRIRSTGNAWAQGYLPSDLAFLPGPPTAAAAPAAVPDENGPTATEIEESFWRLVQDQDDAEGYRAYLDRYADGRYRAAAEARLEALGDPAASLREGEDALGLDPTERRAIQRNLVLLGHDTGGIDGIFGPGTRAAVRSWQSANDVAATGYLEAAQAQSIERQSTRRAADLEAEDQRRLAEMRRAEAAFWRETGEGRDIDGLEAFVDRYPEGHYADQAVAQLRALRNARIDPTGISDVEQQAWDRAQAQGTEEAYEAYANAYPRGRYANRVRQELAALDLRIEGSSDDPEARAAEDSLGLTPLTRRAVEDRLAALDLSPGSVDGAFDGDTRRALRRYQQSADLPVTGYLNQITAVRLLTDSLTASQ